MAKKRNKYAGYLAIKDGKNFLFSTYSVAGDINFLKQMIDPAPEKEKEVEADPAEENTPPDHQKLDQILKSATESAESISALISTMDFSRSVHTGIMKYFDIVQLAKTKGEHIDDYENYQIYGLDGTWFPNAIESAKKINRIHRGFDLLPSSVFLTMISVFDSLVVEFVETMLVLRPERIEASSKEVRISEVLKLDDIAEFRRKVIDDEIYSFSKDSHEEQVRYIQKAFTINVIDHWKRWPDFVEVFERRNLVAHGIRTFNTRYVQKCVAAGHKGSAETLGTEVQLSQAYLEQSLNVLWEFYGLLIFSVWRKLIKDKQAESFSAINEFCFSLISSGIYTAPARIIEFLLELDNVKKNQSTHLMLTVNLASALMHDQKKDEGLAVLGNVDWNTCSYNFQICVAALREDIEKVVSLMPTLKSSNEIAKGDYRIWPVFDFIRSTEKFREAFRQLYDEDIVDSAELQGTSQEDQVDAIARDEEIDLENEGGSVH